MSWLQQFTLVMRSSITTIREKVEDPERMLHQLICDMEEELETVRHSVAGALADEIQLGQQVEKAQAEVSQWETRAETAIRRKDEDTARKALEQKGRSAERLATLEKSHESQKTQTTKLQASYADLEDKIRQARHRKTLLVARLSSAESSKSINAALDRAEGKSAFAEFNRLERRVDRAEAMSTAYDRLAGRDSDADALSEKFAEQERQERITNDLAELKRRLEHSGET